MPLVVDELNDGPELAIQKGYLARVVRVDGDGGLRDEGVLPLEVFVDAKYDGVAATLEFDDDERICPVLYVRSGGELRGARPAAAPAAALRRPGVPRRDRGGSGPAPVLARPVSGGHVWGQTPALSGRDDVDRVAARLRCARPRSWRCRWNDRHAFGTFEAAAPAMSGVRPRTWLERRRPDQTWRFAAPTSAVFGGAPVRTTRRAVSVTTHAIAAP